MTVNNVPNRIIYTQIYTHSLQGFSGYINGHILQSYQECTLIIINSLLSLIGIIC